MNGELKRMLLTEYCIYSSSCSSFKIKLTHVEEHFKGHFRKSFLERRDEYRILSSTEVFTAVKVEKLRISGKTFSVTDKAPSFPRYNT